MACGLPPRDCITDHILPRLDGRTVEERPYQARADCPACQSRGKLAISVGERARAVMHCHARSCHDDWAGTLRPALIRAGVSEQCISGAARRGAGKMVLADEMKAIVLAKMPPVSMRLALLELAGLETSEALDLLGVRRENRARTIRERPSKTMQNRRSPPASRPMRSTPPPPVSKPMQNRRSEGYAA